MPLTLCCLGGHLEMFQWLYSKTSVLISNELLVAASFGGNLNLLVWLYGLNDTISLTNKEITEMYSNNGCLAITIYLCNRDNRITNKTIYWLVMNKCYEKNYYDIFEWLHYSFGSEFKYDCDNLFKLACKHNIKMAHLLARNNPKFRVNSGNIVNHIFDIIPKEILNQIMWTYLDAKDIHSCRQSSTKFHVLTSTQVVTYKDSLKGIHYCVSENKLASLQFMSRFDNIASKLVTHSWIDYFVICCRNGYLDIAKWMWQNENNIDLSRNDCAALKYSCIMGHIDVAKWLCNLDGNIIYNICSNKMNDPYNFHSIVFIKKICANGHLKIIQWLFSILENRIDKNITKNIFSFSCRNNILIIAQWIWENYRISSSKLFDIYNYCACAGYIDIIKWLDKIIDTSSYMNDHIIIECCAKG